MPSGSGWAVEPLAFDLDESVGSDHGCGADEIAMACLDDSARFEQLGLEKVLELDPVLGFCLRVDDLAAVPVRDWPDPQQDVDELPRSKVDQVLGPVQTVGLLDEATSELDGVVLQHRLSLGGPRAIGHLGVE